MKEFIKRNKLTILSFILLLIWGIYSLIKYGIIHDYGRDPLLLFYGINADKLYPLENTAPLFVMIPAVYEFHNNLYTGFVKNKLTRISYKKYMTNIYFKSILRSMLLPLFVIILFIICCIVLKSVSFGSGYEYYGYYTSPDPKYALMPIRFILTFIIVIILDSITYLNLGLICSRKKLSYQITMVLSYLSFIFIDFMGEIIVGGIILARWLNIHYTQDYLNMFNIWVYSGVNNILIFLLYHIFLLILTTTIVYLIYRNKEGVLIEFEK